MSYLSMLLDLEAGKRAEPAPPKPSKGTFEGFGGGLQAHIADADDEQGAFDETAGALEYDHRQPRPVAEAVASLARMKPPEALAGERWAQLLEDAGRFAAEHWAEASAKGWTVLEIFGCSPGFARRLDRDGLVMLLNGRPIGAISSDCIEVTSGRDVLRYRKRQALGAVPMWEAPLAQNNTRAR